MGVARRAESSAAEGAAAPMPDGGPVLVFTLLMMRESTGSRDAQELPT